VGEPLLEANMRIKTIGKPSHISLPIVKKAANFYGKYLIGGGKLYNNLKLTIQFEKMDHIDGDYAYCDWTDDSQQKREFTIGVDRALNKKETLLALAHEMVHLKQYAKGEMKDIWKPVRMVKWQGEKYLHEEMDYWECPWEIEAYGREKGLYFKFINYMREGEPEIKCQPSKRIKIMAPQKQPKIASSNATIL
jgi:hypothetical protein